MNFNIRNLILIIDSTLANSHALRIVYIPQYYIPKFKQAAILSLTNTMRDDPEIGIDWGVTAPILSGKDTLAPLMRDVVSSFEWSAA